MGQPTPPPIIEIADLVRRLRTAAERDTRPGEKPVIWSHRKVVKLLRGEGVRILGAPRCKKSVLLSDLREQFPEFVDSLAFSEQLAEAVG